MKAMNMKMRSRTYHCDVDDSNSISMDQLSEDSESIEGSSTTTESCKSHRHHISTKWSEDEDDRLIRGVQIFGEKNWRNISDFVGVKTNLQCRQRYLKVIAPGIKKGKWSQEEDDLLRLVVKQGVTNWRKVSEQVPGRTSKQCRERWNHYLSPFVCKSPFGVEEDERLESLFRLYGNRWSKIAKELPGRTENQVRFRVEHLKLTCKKRDISKTIRYQIADITVVSKSDENDNHKNNNKNSDNINNSYSKNESESEDNTNSQSAMASENKLFIDTTISSSSPSFLTSYLPSSNMLYSINNNPYYSTSSFVHSDEIESFESIFNNDFSQSLMDSSIDISIKQTIEFLNSSQDSPVVTTTFTPTYQDFMNINKISNESNEITSSEFCLSGEYLRNFLSVMSDEMNGMESSEIMIS